MATDPNEVIHPLTAMLRNNLSLAAQKKARLNAAGEEKRKLLDPSWVRFDPDQWTSTDADSWVANQPAQPGGRPEELRVTSDIPGFNYDAFEKTGQGFDNENKRRAQQRAYADLYGGDPDDITDQQIFDAGKVKQQQIQKQMSEAGRRGDLYFKRREGQDQFDRTLADFAYIGEGPDVVEELSSRENNAAYNAPSNYERRLRDLFSGQMGPELRGKGPRPWGSALKDAGVNAGAFVGNMGTDLAQAAAIGVGLGKQTAGFFQGAREGVQNLKEDFISPQQARRERLSQRHTGMSEELFGIREQEYRASGDGPTEAKVKAMAAEAGDTMQYLWQNPGRVLDGFFESVPYMLGIAGIGRKALTSYTKKIARQYQKELLGDTAALVKEGIDITTDAGKKALADQVKKKTNTFLASEAGQAARKKVSDMTGSTAVGLSEGMSNAAATYAEIMGMSEEEAMQSEQYKALRAGGMAHEDALHDLGVDAYGTVLALNTALAGAASKLTGAGGLEARLLTGRIKKEATEEAADLAKAGGKATAGATQAAAKGGTEVAGEAVRTAGEQAKVTAAKEAEAAVQAAMKVTADTAVKASEDAIKQITTQPASRLKKALLATLKGTAAVGKTVLPSAGKEAAEEAIQSGGGTLLSQLQTSELTGRPVGPGIGAAAGEGAAIGAVSGMVLGGGAEGLRNVSKASLDKLKKAGQAAGEAARKGRDLLKDTEPGSTIGTVGGSKSAAYKRIADESGKGAYDSGKSLSTLMDEAEKDVAGKKSISFENFSEMEAHHGRMNSDALGEQARIQSSDLSPEEKQAAVAELTARTEQINARFAGIKDSFTAHVKAASDKAIDGLKAGTPISQRDAVILAEAVDRGLYTEAEVEEIDQLLLKVGPEDQKATGTVLKQKARINSRLKAAAEAGQQALDLQEQSSTEPDETGEGEQAPLGASRLRGLQVALNKMGNFVSQLPNGGRSVLGAQAHINKIDEAIREGTATGDFSRAEEALQSFKNFVVGKDGKGGQRRKVEELGAILKGFQESGAESGTFTLGTGQYKREYNYTPGVTERWHESLVQEQEQLEGLLAEMDVLREAHIKAGSTPSADKQKAKVAKAKAGQEEDAKAREKRLKKEEERKAKKEAKAAKKETTKPAAETPPKVEEEETEGKPAGKSEKKPVARRKRKRVVVKETPTGQEERVEEQVEETPQEPTGTEGEGTPASKRRRKPGALAQEARLAGDDQLQDWGVDIDGSQLGGETSEETDVALAELNLVQQDINALRAKAQLDQALTPEEDAQLLALLAEGEELLGVLNQDSSLDPDFVAARRQRLYHVPDLAAEGDPAAAGRGIDPGVPQMEIELVVRDILTGRPIQPFEDDPFGDNAENVVGGTEVGGTSQGTQVMESEETRTALYRQSNQRVRALMKFVQEDETLSDTQKADQLKTLKDLQANLTSGYNNKDAKRLFYNSIRDINKQFARNTRPPGYDKLINLHKQVSDLAHAVGRWFPKDDQVNKKALKARDALVLKWAENPDGLSAVEMSYQVVQDSLAFFKQYGYPSSIEVFSAGSIRLSDLKKSGLLSDMNLQREQEQQGIPDGIEDAFKTNYKDIRGLIAAVPNLYTLLSAPALRKAIVEALSLTAEEVVMLDALMDFTAAFRNTLNDQTMDAWYDPEGNPITDQKNRLPYKNGQYSGEVAKEEPLNYFRDSNGDLNENLILAMAMAAQQYLTTRSWQTLSNDDAAINSILRRPSYHPVSPTERARLGSVGVSKNLIKDELGTMAYNMLNIRNSSTEYGSMEDRLVSNLGLMTISTLHAMGVFELGGVSASMLDDMRSDEIDTGAGVERKAHTSVPTNNFLRVQTEEVYNESTGHSYLRPVEAVRALLDTRVGGSTLMDRLMGVKVRYREPSLEAPTREDVPTRVRNSNATVSPKQQDAVEIINSRVWVEAPLAGLMMRMPGMTVLEMGHGVLTEEQLAAKHANTRENYRARNQQLTREWDFAFDWHRRNAGKKFFFKYFVASNLRVMIDSNTLNVQNSKLHRYLYQMEEWLYEVPHKDGVTPENAEAHTAFRLSIAQGLGIKIDSGKSINKILAELDALIKEPAYQEAMAFLDQQLDLEQQLAAGTITSLENISVEAMEVLRPILKKNKTHALAALYEWTRYQRTPAGATFSTALPLEIDGVTNGYAATNMQFPLDITRAPADYINSMRAAGINLKDHDQPFQGKDNYQDIASRVYLQQKALLDKQEEYAEELEELDNKIQYHQNNGSWDTVNKLQERKKELLFQQEHTQHVLDMGMMATWAIESTAGSDSIEVTEAGRDDAKKIFVPANYGAGRASSRRSVVDLNVERFYDQLADSSAKDPAGNSTGTPTQKTYTLLNQARMLINGIRTARMEAGIAGTADLLPDDWMQNIPQDESVMEVKLGETELKDLKEAFDAVHGYAVAAALESKLSAQEAMRERLHQINILANMIYEKEFDRRVQEYTKRFGEPGRRARRKIIQQLMGEDLLPGLKTAFTVSITDRLDTTEDSIEFSESGEHKNRIAFNEALPSEDYFLDENGMQESNKHSRSTTSGVSLRRPTSKVGVAAMVTFTHSFDSANNSRVYTQDDFHAANLHDAVMVRATAATQASEIANQGFYEEHRDLAMVDSYYQMLERMVRMLSTSDTRFSKAEKAEIWERFFNEGLRGTAKKNRPQTLDLWIKDMGKAINKVKANRAILFGAEGITSIRNFRFPESGTHVVDPKSPDSRAPSERVSSADNLETMVNRWAEAIFNANIQERDNAVAMLTVSIDNEKVFRDVLERYIQENRPTGFEMLSMLETVYDRTGRTAAKEAVQNALKMLDEKGLRTVRVVPWSGHVGTEPGDAGAYIPSLDQIQINFALIKTDKYQKINPVVSLLHESIHAGTYSTLEALYDEDAAKFKKTFIGSVAKAVNHDVAQSKQGVKIPPGRAHSNSMVAAYLRQARAAERNQDPGLARDMYLLAAAEFVAHRVTDVDTRNKSFQDISPEFWSDPSRFASINILENLRITAIEMRREAAEAAKARAARRLEETDPVNPAMGSSGTGVNRDLFSGTGAQLTTSATIRELFQQYDEHGFVPDNPEADALLDHVMDDLLIPGTQSLESLYQRVAVNSNGTTNEGEFENGTIYIEAAGNQRTVPVHEGAMSLKEVYAHELVHAIFEAGIDGNVFIRRQVQRLFDLAKEQLSWHDFMPAVVTGDIVHTQRIARQRYDYIFNNTEGNALHEFAAIGLTNHVFATKLKNLREQDVSKPLWEGANIRTLANMLSAAISWIADRVMQTRGTNLHASLNKLAHATIAINNQNRATAARMRDGDLDHDGRYAKVAGTANNYVAKLIAEKVVDPLHKYARNQEKKISTEVHAAKARGDKPPKLGIRGTADVLLASAFGVGSEGFEQALNSVLDGTKQTRDSAIPNIISELFRVDPRNFNWSNIMRESRRLIDGVRRETIESTTRVLLDAFDKATLRKLTSANKESITNVILKTDMVSLMDRFTMAQLFQLLQNPDNTPSHIKQVEEELRTILKNDTSGELYRLFTTQAEGLGVFMATGNVALRNQMPNAYTISNQFMLEDMARKHVDPAALPKVERLIDHLATLHALNNTSNNDLENVVPLFDYEMNRQTSTNGFLSLLGQHKAFKEQALKRSFNGIKTNMWKGYVYENYDPSYTAEMVEDTPENNDRMRRQGYTRVASLRKDPVDKKAMPWRKEMNLWVSHRGLSTYQKSTISLRDNHHRGFDITAAIDAGKYVSTPAARAMLSGQVVNEMRKANFRGAYKQMSAGFQMSDPARESIMLPVLDDGGRIVGYRYVMAEQTKKDVLKKQDMFDVVMGRMYGSIEDKQNTKIVNSKAAKLMYSEYKAFGDDDRHTFVEFSPNSKDRRVQEMYRLLPRELRAELEQLFGGKTFYLRDEAVNMALGYRKLALADIPQLGEMRSMVYILEKGWREFIAYSKVKMVIQTPAVALGNLASNMILLVQDGIPPAYAIKKGIEAAVSMGNYQATMRKRNDLEKVILRDTALGRNISLETRSKYAELQASLEANPVHYMVDEGLISSIVDEFEVDEHSYRGKLITGLKDKATQAAPRAIVNAASELWMLPGSKTYDLAMKFTQYSDYVGRYVKHQYDTNVRHKPRDVAIHDALEMFVYYDRPQHPYLQFANDNGHVMFTKFFLRIQPVAVKLYQENPVTAVGYFILQQALMGHPYTDNITNYLALGQLEGLDRRFHAWPLEAISGIDYTTPGLASWLMLPFNGGIPVAD